MLNRRFTKSNLRGRTRLCTFFVSWLKETSEGAESKGRTKTSLIELWLKSSFAAMQRWCRFSIYFLRVIVVPCIELAFKARLPSTSWDGTTKPSTVSELAQHMLYSVSGAVALYNSAICLFVSIAHRPMVRLPFQRREMWIWVSIRLRTKGGIYSMSWWVS